MDNAFKSGLRVNLPDIRKEKVPTIQNQKKSNIRRTLKTPKAKLTLATLGLSAALTVSGLGIAGIIENRNNKKIAFDLEESIKTSAAERIKDMASWDVNEIAEKLNFEDGRFSLDTFCERPELYKLLSSTDIDDKLNEYYGTTNKEEKQGIRKELNRRINEIREYNVNLVKAVLADSKNTTIDDITIDVTLISNSAEERAMIAAGKEDYKGHTLRVEGAEGYNNPKNFTYNFNSIPEYLFDMLSDVAFQYEAPNCSYFSEDYKGNQSEEILKDYAEIKKYINDGNFTVENGKFYFEKKGELYTFDEYGKIHEVEEQELGR